MPRLCPMETGFGYIVVAGRRYDHDVVVAPDGTVSRRRKELSKPEADLYAHTPLSARELEYYLKAYGDVDCVAVGTGQDGGMRVTPEASRILEELEHRGVRVVVALTPQLTRMCSLLETCRRPLIVVHVTC